jgi:hypothetical protein
VLDRDAGPVKDGAARDRHVALLGLSPRRRFPIVLGEPGAQAVELAVRLADLPVHQPKPFSDGST